MCQGASDIPVFSNLGKAVQAMGDLSKVTLHSAKATGTLSALPCKASKLSCRANRLPYTREPKR